MKTADGRPVQVVNMRDRVSILVGKRNVMELPHGAAAELLAGMAAHTAPHLEEYAATDDGRPVGLAVKADAMLFFVKGRRVMEIANTDLAAFSAALRGEGEHVVFPVPEDPKAVELPTSAELLNNKRFLEMVQCNRYGSTLEAPAGNHIFARTEGGDWIDLGPSVHIRASGSDDPPV